MQNGATKAMGNTYATAAPTHNWRLLFYCAFVMFYLSFVSFIFTLIESPAELQIKNDILRVRAEFLRNNSCMSEAELEQFIVAVLNANMRGVSLVQNASTSPTWTFAHSFFLTTTVVTTIGYGRSTPQTELGKLFCMLVVITGVPVMLLMFSALVERLEYVNNVTLIWFWSRCAIRFKWSVLKVRLVHLSAIVLLVVVVLFAIPAWIFTSLEYPDWSYLDSLYFTFISMATVGLGDFIPAYQLDLDHRSLYKVGVAFYLIFGLTIMMLLLTLVYAIPELHLGMRLRIVSDRTCAPSSESLPNPLFGESTNSPLGDERLHLRTSSSTQMTRYVDESHVSLSAMAGAKPNNLQLPSVPSNGTASTIGSSPTGSDTGIIANEH